MTRLVECYNLRFKTCVKIFFEEITGIRSQGSAIFSENNEVVLGDSNQFFFYPVLQMSANGASCQELQITLKNRFRTNFFDKIMDLSLLFFTLET
jgi:hypothetical protein